MYGNKSLENHNHAIAPTYVGYEFSIAAGDADITFKGTYGCHVAPDHLSWGLSTWSQRLKINIREILPSSPVQMLIYCYYGVVGNFKSIVQYIYSQMVTLSIPEFILQVLL